MNDTKQAPAPKPTSLPKMKPKTMLVAMRLEIGLVEEFDRWAEDHGLKRGPAVSMAMKHLMKSGKSGI